MPIDTTKYLTHLGQYTKAVLNSSGETDVSSTSVTTLACFAYFGQLDRRAGIPGFAKTAPDSWNVIVPTSAVTLVAVGDSFVNIVDQLGQPVKDSGVVDDVIIYRHHNYGVQFVQVKLAKN